MAETLVTAAEQVEAVLPAGGGVAEMVADTGGLTDGDCCASAANASNDPTPISMRPAGCAGEAGFRDQCAAALCATDPAAVLTHMPLARFPHGCVHLYGHLHARRHRTPQRLDIGVDAIGFAPRRFDWLLEDLA